MKNRKYNQGLPKPSVKMYGHAGPAHSCILAVVTLCLVSFAPHAVARNIFLNGIDISSARSQILKNVDIQINEQGQIFIIAPHYQVNEEDSYVPLSKYIQNSTQPVHQAPIPMVEGVPAPAFEKEGKKLKSEEPSKAAPQITPPAAAEGAKDAPASAGVPQ